MCLSFIYDFWLLDIILNSTELKGMQNIKLYHFVHTILSVPFCPLPFCPVTATCTLLLFLTSANHKPSPSMRHSRAFHSKILLPPTHPIIHPLTLTLNETHLNSYSIS